MKALEKAAKDRGESAQPAAAPAQAVNAAPAVPAGSRAAEAPAPAPAKIELSLEPLAVDTPPVTERPAPAAAPQPRQSAKAEREAPRAAAEQARAATVMQATAGTAPSPGRKRMSPLVLFGAVAALAVIGGGIYVYLQITNPGLFIRQPAAQPPLAQAPATPPAAAPVAPAPVATSAVIAPDAAAKPEAAAPAAPPVAASAAPQPPRTATAASPAAEPARPAAPRDGIKVSAGNAEPQLDPKIGQAYAALQSGKIDTAKQLYADALRDDPRNINALLGSAAVAIQEGRADDASRSYFRVLELEPRNAYAQAGLVSLAGRADPLAAETRLKQLIAREPQASLHFTLGNLYGDQSRWAEAQQAFFQAHHLEPSNPDYAYNLAVGLEHVGQAKLAAGFYRRAIELAQARGRAGFNLNQAQDRIRLLAAQPE